MTRSVINYNKLKYFTVAARCKSISRAAEELYIGQPALSTHIRELEEEIGVQLFIRTKRSLILTEAGEVLYEKTAAFFDEEEELLNAVRSAAARTDAVLRIGCIGANVIKTLPGLVHEFSKECPDLDIRMVRYNDGPLLAALNNREADLILRIQIGEADSLSEEQYDVSVLKTGQSVAVMSKDHPLAEQDSISVSELKNCRFGILNKDQSANQYVDFYNLCRKAGFKPNITEEYLYIEALLTSINLGNVITLTSSFAPFENYDNIRCVPLNDCPPAKLCMIQLKNNPNVYAKQFARFAESSLSDQII